MRQQTQIGHALVEFALLLPLLATLLVGVAELGNAINAYVTVIEASREGARLAVRKGGCVNAASDIQQLVRTLAQRLPAFNQNPIVVYANEDADPCFDSVTVRVRYDYQFISDNTPLLRGIIPRPFTLSASTTMALP